MEKSSSSLLAITCGGCHTLRTLAQTSSHDQMIVAKADIENKLHKKKGKILVTEFNQDLTKYSYNEQIWFNEEYRSIERDF